MCGIAGIISNEKICKDLKKDFILKMLSRQKHRGRNFSNYVFCDNSVILGHNLLSTISFLKNGNQPLSDSYNRYHITYNGSIYNYDVLKEELSSEFNFSKNTDTEVLLYGYIKWGKKVLNKLQGMFAFAIYDSHKKEIFLARDHFGIKPLYFSLHNESFYFSSEIKALHNTDIPKINNEIIWANYFKNGLYSYDNQTFFKNIFELKAGHYIKFNINQINVNQIKWYCFVDNINALQQDFSYSKRTRKEHLENYFNILNQSIFHKIEKSQEIGLCLSSGLDSQILYHTFNSLYKEKKNNVFTFHCYNIKYDESAAAKNLYTNKNTVFHKIGLHHSEVIPLFYKISENQDEPFGGIPTIAYSKIFENAKEKNVNILFDANGIDEAWASYDYYTQNKYIKTQGKQNTFYENQIFYTEFLNLAPSLHFPTPFKNNLLNQQYRDLFFTKIPRVLRFNDRVSNLYTTELHQPFLSHKLVEYAFALPQHIKILQFQKKWAIQSILKSKYNVVSKPYHKRTLQTPQVDWMQKELSNWVEQHIENLENHAWVDKNKLQKQWKLIKKTKLKNTFFLWQWISLSHYFKN